MIALQSVLSRLESITSPAIGYTNDTNIVPPPSTDTSPAAIFKRDLFSRCITVLHAGKAMLQSQTISLQPGIQNNDFDYINNILANDVDQRDYFDLLHVASTAQLLILENNK